MMGNIFILYSNFKNVRIFGYSALSKKASIDFKGLRYKYSPIFLMYWNYVHESTAKSSYFY